MDMLVPHLHAHELHHHGHASSPSSCPRAATSHQVRASPQPTNFVKLIPRGRKSVCATVEAAVAENASFYGFEEVLNFNGLAAREKAALFRARSKLEAIRAALTDLSSVDSLASARGRSSGGGRPLDTSGSGPVLTLSLIHISEPTRPY